MDLNSPLFRRVPETLRPDSGRVVARLFLPGEELPQAHSRACAVINRVLGLSDAEVEQIAAELLVDFSDRHRDYSAILAEHAAIVGPRVDEEAGLSRARMLLLGAGFTAEYAVEGAALCNPSAVPSPDQTGLRAGQLRVAVSLRGIGEGHLSSIGFCSAVIGPGAEWSFEPRRGPVVAATTTPGSWRREHLGAVLTHGDSLEELISAILSALPAEFNGVDLELTLLDVHPELLTRPGAPAAVDTVRHMVASAYDATFPADVGLAQRVLLPTSADECNGIEDARFVRFVEADGTVDYRATYTAYDGHQIAPRLLRSPDLRSFRFHRLAGPAAQNKGIALFPRQVGGRYLALCRSDGESTSVSGSDDGYIWDDPQLVHPPQTSWELLQVGNCGPPIETEQGWLVLTHGVGAMRVYSIGVMLLDLADPTRLIGRLDRPLLSPGADQREGYVPNVVYSCGGLVHDGNLWLPYGVGDARINVGWVPLDQLLDQLTR